VLLGVRVCDLSCTTRSIGTVILLRFAGVSCIWVLLILLVQELARALRSIGLRPRVRTSRICILLVVLLPWTRSTLSHASILATMFIATKATVLLLHCVGARGLISLCGATLILLRSRRVTLVGLLLRRLLLGILASGLV